MWSHLVQKFSKKVYIKTILGNTVPHLIISAIPEHGIRATRSAMFDNSNIWKPTPNYMVNIISCINIESIYKIKIAWTI